MPTDQELAEMAIEQRNALLAEIKADFEQLAPIVEEIDEDARMDAYERGMGW
jgi:hypothetical protein